MAQHVSRKELKKDEVRDTFMQGISALASHQLATLYVVIVALVIVLGVFGWRGYTTRETAKASAAFESAMNVFQAAVTTPGVPVQPGALTYKDEQTKYTDAAQKFGDVATKYPRARPGELARYYAALSLEKLGKNDDAKKWLQGLTGSSDQDFAAMADFELAQLDDRMGQGDEAAKVYQGLIDKPTILVPKPVVMLALAHHYSQNNPAEAAKLYAQIKSEYPDTAIAEQADQDLALLPGKS
ncbi:MAG: tetratricopeptide repeat protein [Acidobacteriaceae bacterium]